MNLSKHIRFRPKKHSNGSLQKEPNGLIKFTFDIIEDGELLESIDGCSGLGDYQRLRAYDDKNAKPGSAEPLPEGIYNIGPDEYDKAGIWPAGLAGRWMDLLPAKGFALAGGRSAFGLHPDGNAPGSLGCACPYTISRWERVVQWWHKGFKILVVDHGLGKVPKINKVTKEETGVVELDGQIIGKVMIHEGTSYMSATAIAKLLKVNLVWDNKSKVLRVIPDNSKE